MLYYGFTLLLQLFSDLRTEDLLYLVNSVTDESKKIFLIAQSSLISDRSSRSTFWENDNYLLFWIFITAARYCANKFEIFITRTIELPAPSEAEELSLV